MAGRRKVGRRAGREAEERTPRKAKRLVRRGPSGALVGVTLLVLALVGRAAGGSGPDDEDRGGAGARAMSLRIYSATDDAASRVLTAAETEALLGAAGAEGARAAALQRVGLELDVAAEALRTEATQDALVAVATDMLGRAGIRRSWRLPPVGVHSAAAAGMPQGAVLLAMASYMKAAHAHARASAQGLPLSPPAVYPPALLNLSAVPFAPGGAGAASADGRGVFGADGGGGSAETRAAWQLVEAVEAGVVSVEGVQATGWCDRVRVALASHRVASLSLVVAPGLALEPRYLTLNPKPYTLNPKPQTPNPKPQTPNPRLALEPWYRNSQRYTLSPKPFWIHTCTHTYMHTRTHTYMHTRTHTHTHTHTHTRAEHGRTKNCWRCYRQ